MRQEQRQAAREMYFQGGATKTEIAQALGVSRRSIYQWSIEGNWDQLKKSAMHMPAIMAEKAYYVLGHLTDNILMRESAYETVSKTEVDMMYKLALTVSKLKQGSTVNESMQTFTLLLERMKKDDPGLAGQVVPYVDKYVSDRRKVSESSFLLQGFNDAGFMDFPEKQIQEKWRDEEDLNALMNEMQAGSSAQPPVTPAPVQPVAQSPAPAPLPHKPLFSQSGHTAQVAQGHQPTAHTAPAGTQSVRHSGPGSYGSYPPPHSNTPGTSRPSQNHQAP